LLSQNTLENGELKNTWLGGHEEINPMGIWAETKYSLGKGIHILPENQRGGMA